MLSRMRSQRRRLTPGLYFPLSATVGHKAAMRFNARWYAICCWLAHARQTLVQWSDSPELPSLMLPMCVSMQNVTFVYNSGLKGGGEGEGQETRSRRQGQGHRAPFSSHLSTSLREVRSWPASSSCVRYHHFQSQVPTIHAWTAALCLHRERVDWNHISHLHCTAKGSPLNPLYAG